MTRSLSTLALAAVVAATLVAAGGPTLDIYFIDVEGGQSTLIRTPSGESLLVDAGYPARGGRDPDRIMAAVADAGITRIDYLLVTHFHNDHVGSVPELVKRIPIGTFIDYGDPLGGDRMATNGFRNYEPVRAEHPHLRPAPGDRLPLTGIDVQVVSAAGELIEKPLPGAGRANEACVNVEDHVEDGTENYRSIGVLLQWGAFRFLDLGDLSGNTLTRLACPRAMIAPVSAYLIAHHGDYDSNVPALYAALRPQVAIMNNGLRKGGSPDAFKTLRAQAGMDLWQLHWSANPRADNAPDEFIANLDDGATDYWLKLSAAADGSFSMQNRRTGLTRHYPPAAAPASSTARAARR